MNKDLNVLSELSGLLTFDTQSMVHIISLSSFRLHPSSF